MFGEYKWGEEFKISKVSYEDGVRSFKFGDETRNNLWINQDNMYIVDEEQIESIYNKVNGLIANSFEGKTIIDPAIDIGDKIIIDGKSVIYQGEMVLEGRFITEISSKIQIKQKEETTVKKESQKVVNRRVQSEINQIDGKITQLIDETTENSQKLSQHKQTIDSITERVSNIEKSAITNVSVEYALSDSTTTAPESGWSTTAPEWQEGKYMWQRTVTTYEDKTVVTGKAVCISGAVGQQGDKGIGINKIETQYYLSTSKTTQTGGSWKTTQDTWTEGTYYWIRTKITYDNNEVEYTTPILNEDTNSIREAVAEVKTTAEGLDVEVKKKLGITELGTQLEQNWEHIKVAWNQISQYLQMEGIDGKATLNIYDENNNMLMSLSQDGQTFYDSSGNKIGTVGIVREDDKDTLAFAMNVDWDNVTESKSMAWGFFDKEGNFLPIFNLRSYYGQESSEYGGELGVAGTLAVGEEVRVEQGGVLFGTEGTEGSLDGHNGNLIYTSNGEVVAYISKNMLALGDYINGYVNELGGHTVSCEYFNASNVPNTNNITMISASGGDYGSIFANINDGSYVCIYANNSDRNLKKNIKTTENKAIEKINKINHVEFDWKSNGEHQNIGYIAQEMNEIDSNFVHYSKYKDTNGEEKENWQINTLSVLATATKAIQEQQEEIERLKEKDKQKDEIIANLIARIEKIEKGE